MTDSTQKTEASDQRAPKALEDAELDQATGDWGKTMYHSYSNDQSASYTSRSSDTQSLKPGSTTYANITLEENSVG